MIDDSALVRKLFCRVLASEPDFEVFFARDGLEGIELLHKVKPDVVTLDIQMPQMDGLACLSRIMIERPSPVVMVSSLTSDSAEGTLEALRLGAVDFVGKPEGALSLQMEVFAPQFVDKVRSAAGAKLKASLHLRQRVQHRLSGAPLQRGSGRRTAKTVARETGEGIVLIGTSTGGPPALEAVLEPLPSTFPWPIVIAQHMPASFTGPLARRLNDLCAIGVTEVTCPTVLKPGCAYIGRGDTDVIVSWCAGGLIAMPVSPETGRRWMDPPVATNSRATETIGAASCP